MFAAAIFDMDGLLVDSESVIMDAWISAAAQCGARLSAADYIAVVGVAAAESDAILTRLLGGPGVFNTAEKKAAAILARKQSPFSLKPGAKELLTVLRDAGVPCAVASSSSRHEIEQRLEDVGILQFFNAHAGGDEVPKGKPDPAIYMLAASRIGVTPVRKELSGCATVVSVLKPDEMDDGVARTYNLVFEQLGKTVMSPALALYSDYLRVNGKPTAVLDFPPKANANPLAKTKFAAEHKVDEVQ